MVANDFRYYKSCLSAYLMKSSEEPEENDNVHVEGLNWLISYIENVMLSKRSE